MSTSKARLNISLSKDLRIALAKAAKREGVPNATKAGRLLETALELEEDQIWDTMTARRDTKKSRYVLHDNAWR